MSALWAVALIMLLSGTAKLRSGEDVQATFTRLRVPRPFAAPALARAFPWLELLLAAALLQPFTLLRPVVGLVAVALFAAFLALVVRAQDDGVSCGCFGEASAAPISRTTVVRNVVFLALAVLALAEGIVSLAVHGAGLAWQPLTAFGAGAWAWALLVSVLLATAALVTAVMVSIAGAIGFVGLVVPHAMRFLVGVRHARLVPATALAGAVFLVLSDVVSRIVIPGQVLPIGVITALVGAPAFAVVMVRGRRR